MPSYEDIASKLTGVFGTGKTTKAREEKDRAKYIMEQYELGKNAKEETKTKWIEHVKLWRGDHWKHNRASWKSKTVENLCFSIVETMIPLMGDRQPTINYLPQTQEDEEHANKMNSVASYIWNADGMEEKMPTIIRDSLILGTGIGKMRWETSKFNGMGDITMDAVDPFNVFVDPDATDPSNLEWVIMKTKISVKKIEKQYGKKVPSDKDYYDDHMRPTDTNDGKVSQYSSTAATILEFWHYDDDGQIMVSVVSNGVLLDEKPTPYEINEFPFIFFYDHKLNGEFWGVGEYENLKPLQYEMNKVRAMYMDNMIATNNTMIIVDSTAGVKMKDLRNEPGLMIEKQPGGQITRLAPPPLPGYFQDQIETNRIAMQQVSGVNDITKGIAGGQTAASAIQILTENSQTRLRGKLKNIEAGVKKLGRWYVALVRQFYTEPRIIRLVDGNEGIHFIDFDGRDLRPQIPVMDPNTGQPVIDPETGQMQMEEGFTEFDVNISSGSSMMLNKSAKYQQTLELYQNGAADIETLLKSADIGNTDEIIQRLIAYGKMADPNEPKVDVTKILADLGMKVNITTNNPDVVLEHLTQMKQQADQMNQQEIADAAAMQKETERLSQQQAREQVQMELAPKASASPIPPSMMPQQPEMPAETQQAPTQMPQS